ncbi:T6SS effector amidase Tae4 family protein [Massilia sp. DWR3-1-1]|uniref:T6SS effector amidase Tae4 family protein n=1 Tax=Massilia sp. DWR3-1-1 TaxID=2804559 RepID=UPI003CFB49E3
MSTIDDSSAETGGGSAPSPHKRARAGEAAVKVRPATPGPTRAACPAGAALPRFADMWRGYPEGQPSTERWQSDIIEQGIVLARKGELKYPDQCAIKLSVALHAGGVDMRAYPGAATVIDGKRAGLRAAELAAWLNRQAFCGVPLALRVTGADWKDQIANKTGIIYFANYWRRSGESKPSGDHIDLWNRSTLSPSLESFFRFRLGIDRIPNPFERLRGQPGNWYSNLDEATEILLWEVA